MYRTIEDFQKDWEYEAASTTKLLANITDASLSQRINPEGRELGRLASHIIESPAEMLRKAGLSFDAVPDHLETPETAAELAPLYESTAGAVMNAVTTSWTDASLTEEVSMYGQTWTKGTVLSIMVLHQSHHRGQLTVLMRQAGLPVIGIYGPSREEWIAYGMPALA